MSTALQRGLSAHQNGQLAEAEIAYHEHLGAHPIEPNGLHMLGLLRHQQGDHGAAADLIGRAIAAGAPGAAPHANLSAVHLALEDYPAAAAVARAALTQDGAHFGALLNLGLACAALGEDHVAQAVLTRAFDLRPDDSRAGPALARVQEQRGDLEASLSTRRRYAHARSQDAAARFQLGAALSRQGRLVEAVAALRATLELPDPPRDTRLLLATALLDLGEVEASLRQSLDLLAVAPDYAEARSNALIALQHLPSVDNAQLYEAHADWAARHAPVAAAVSQRGPEPAVFRIGLVSPRFHESPVATFLLPLLRALDRRRHAVTAYVCSRVTDAATTQLRSLCQGWRDVTALDDDAFCAQVRADSIDVLIDLAGHAPANRLSAFTRHPAPLQIAWLDYFCTTGIAALDWFFTDPVLTPPDSDQRFAERVYRLPRSRLCYEPPADAPPVQTRAHADSVRFASFNRLAKLNADVAASWSAILHAVPGSTLRLKASALADARTRDWVYATRFAPHGIARDRLEFEAFSSYAQTMAAYGEVDIALDTFPFSGCATSCDALWMGVPVVTLAGATLVGRQTASLLHAVALDELIAADHASYVAAAVALAQDRLRRADLRSLLRDRVQRSLGDAATFAAEFDHALRQCWRDLANTAAR